VRGQLLYIAAELKICHYGPIGEISETIRDRLLRFDAQVPEFLTQRKFVSAARHAHSNAQNCSLYSFDARIKLKRIVLIKTYRLIKKKFDTPTLTPTIFMLDKKL